jgi:hypothetical protein
MIETALITLSEELVKYPVVQKTYGVAALTKVRTGDVTKTVLTSGFCSEGTGEPIVPIFPDTGITFFWQMLESRVKERTPNDVRIAGRVRSVFWGNVNALNPPSLEILNALAVSTISQFKLSGDWLNIPVFELEAMETNNPAIFSGCDFDETETQYNTYPYQTASCDWFFEAYVLLNCLPEITPVQC